MKARMIGCILCLTFFASCKKNWSAQAQPEVAAQKTSPSSLEQWSGRADFTESAWQIR